ncbi:cell division protein FtsQ/DivIB [Carnobacterium mobile]|uniref:cell division protein FtsQ/DivIB n=1 Tax=Carnobacterium mobile TaxID=2750 RepID=UPI000A03199E|nr:cell division protein FtsQ/DivIB [Carnobacterium mobile]
MADERKTFNKKKKLPAQLSSVGKENESLKKNNYKRAGQSEGKDYSLEDKLPKLKEKRRKKMYRRLVSLLFLFSFAILIVVYFITPLSKVDQVSVSGTKEVTDQAVIDASQIRSGDSLWETFFSRNKIETTVKKQLPQVKSMKLKFNSINSYELVVSEYKTVAYLEKGDEYYNILSNGKIVNESRKISIGNPPIFVNFKEGKALNKMLEQYQVLNENIHNSISEIEYTPSKTDDYLITLYMNDGNQVVASILSFAEKMVYYPDIVEKIGEEKGVINIEVGIYFMPFESESPKENTESANNKE